MMFWVKGKRNDTDFEEEEEEEEATSMCNKQEGHN